MTTCDICHWPQQWIGKTGQEVKDNGGTNPRECATEGISFEERPLLWWRFSGYEEVFSSSPTF